MDEKTNRIIGKISSNVIIWTMILGSLHIFLIAGGPFMKAIMIGTCIGSILGAMKYYTNGRFDPDKMGRGVNKMLFRLSERRAKKKIQG